MSEPDSARQLRPIFLSLMGRRVRELNLWTEQKQVALRWRARYEASWRESRKRVGADDREARDRDTAVASSLVWRCLFARAMPGKCGWEMRHGVFPRSRQDSVTRAMDPARLPAEGPRDKWRKMEPGAASIGNTPSAEACFELGAYPEYM